MSSEAASLDELFEQAYGVLRELVTPEMASTASDRWSPPSPWLPVPTEDGEQP